VCVFGRHLKCTCASRFHRDHHLRVWVAWRAKRNVRLRGCGFNRLLEYAVCSWAPSVLSPFLATLDGSVFKVIKLSTTKRAESMTNSQNFGFARCALEAHTGTRIPSRFHHKKAKRLVFFRDLIAFCASLQKPSILQVKLEKDNPSVCFWGIRGSDRTL